jgi:hypothetical protein
MEDSALPLVEELVKQVPARDDHGRLLPGNTANPNGRPKRKTLTELLHERLDNTPNGWEDVVTVILGLVSRKDREIIKELWHYTDGKPKESQELSGSVEIVTRRSPTETA